MAGLRFYFLGFLGFLKKPKTWREGNIGFLQNSNPNTPNTLQFPLFVLQVDV
jgi:hypothetical protein